MIKVTTESNSVYILDTQNKKVLRSNHENTLRQDQKWLTYSNKPELTVGKNLVLLLEPLGEGIATLRTTTPVVTITQIENDSTNSTNPTH